MQAYLNALYDFCLNFKPLEEITYGKKNLVFIGASATLGFFIVLLDMADHYLFKKSFLGLNYGSRTRYIGVIIAWTFASSFVSYLGLIIHVFNSTIQSCAVVGISWLFIIVRLTKKLNQPEEVQK